MGHFNYARMSQGLLTPKTVELLTAIYEYKGRQALYLNAKTDVLDALTEVAKVQSTVASNASRAYAPAIGAHNKSCPRIRICAPATRR